MGPLIRACSAAFRSRERGPRAPVDQRGCWDRSAQRTRRRARFVVISSTRIEVIAMRFVTRDLPLVPLLLPVVAIGLFPLVMLPLLGFLGFVVLGILLGFAAVMAELEEQGAHTAHVISHGGLSRAEHAGYSLEMQKLMRSLFAVKIVSLGLIVLGGGGFIIKQYS